MVDKVIIKVPDIRPFLVKTDFPSVNSADSASKGESLYPSSGNPGGNASEEEDSDKFSSNSGDNAPQEEDTQTDPEEGLPLDFPVEVVNQDHQPLAGVCFKVTVDNREPVNKKTDSAGIFRTVQPENRIDVSISD